MRVLRSLWRDQGAATAVEYGIIVAAVAGLVIAVVFALGKKVKNDYNTVNAAFP